MSEKSKRHPDFPLFLHQSGQWAKKIKGRLRYFGTDREAALDRWLRDRDELLAGREPSRTVAGLRLRDLVNRFLTSKQSMVDSGELSPRTWSHYHGTCSLLLDAFGKTWLVESLVAADFERLRARLAAVRGALALAGEIQRIRTLFRYAWDEELIEKPVRFGTIFRKPSGKQLRAAKHEAEPWMIGAEDLRVILETAEQPLRAMILLGINRGFGNSDIASLPKAAVDLDSGWVSFPRPKTEIPRRCRLCPETIEAVREAIAMRPQPHEAADAGLVFLTAKSFRWVRVDPQPGNRP